MKYVDEIFTLVKNHFSLDSRSLDFFKNRLYNFEIPEFYKNYFNGYSDLRKEFAITSDIRQRIDPGWKKFQDDFYSLIMNSGITYEEFRENKKTVDKNTIKLKKIIMDFYLKNKNEIMTDFGINRETIKNSVFVPFFEDLITKKLELIGLKKLPNEELKIVVSNNFADWFMCSTSESWSSCLNFRSEFSGAYWSGLPGLIGDPNRTMMYITNGETKEFYGIKTEKFINRSFGLLNIDDLVFLLKFYPLKEMLPVNAIAEITNLPITQNFERTKYPITILYHDEPINKSCFIYQDETNFYSEGKEFYLISGEREFYWMGKGSRSRHMKQFLHYKLGLPFLIEKGFSIADVQPKTCCSGCGKQILFNEETFIHEDREYCLQCKENKFIYCLHCGKLEYKGNMKKTPKGYYCVPCYQELYTIRCDECGCRKSKDYIFENEGKNYCASCAINKYNNLVRCDNCSKIIFKNEFGLCSSCKEEIDKRKKLKGSLKLSVEPVYNIVWNVDPMFLEEDADENDEDDGEI